MRPIATARLLTRSSLAPVCCALSFFGAATTALAQTPTPSAEVPPETGRLVVREKQEQTIRVLIDGIDRGPAPLTLDLPPRSYEVRGIASSLVAAPQKVTVEKGATSQIVLEAVPAMARVEVRTSDGQGKITIDGRAVGEGAFDGELPVGKHVLRVEREGFEPFEKSIRLGHGQVIVESVTLEQRAESTVAAVGPAHRVRDGWYGGVQLGLALMPASSDHSLDSGCDAIGATSCDASKPWGASVLGYAGYALEPLGFELMFGLLGDQSSSDARFDGVHGSSINPLVAQPARDEEFRIYRAGALGAVRVRGNVDLSSVRLSAAVGAGLTWKTMGMKRSVKTTDGTNGTSEFGPDNVSYWSPGVTLDVGVQMPLGETTTLVAGAWFWAETARNAARTTGASNQVITADGQLPRPIATPSYDLANGDQLYVGPYLGMQFGP